jgi:hypothetical protein
MNYRFAASTLADIAAKIRQYEGFGQDATWLLAISAELYKKVPPVPTIEELQTLLPPPNRTDPNSKIPRPKIPPQGGSPVHAPLTNGVAS